MASVATTFAEGTDKRDQQVELRYVEKLKGIYAGFTATRTSEDQWPPPCTRRVFNLAMVKEEEVQRGRIKDSFVRMSITGKLDDIMQVKYPVKLENIFKDVDPKKRKVILMEGAPGCGKSTLSIFISQQWGEGKLFTEYKAVVLVRLRDPDIQKAKSIVDLMPSLSEDSTITRQAVEEMQARNFKDVLFILDGWDELPASLRKAEKSIFRKLIQQDLAENNGLQGSAVVVTSRPVTSGDLQKIVSARVEILGFTPEELNDYFRDCLGNDVVAVRELLDKIEENPLIKGSCYLPLNASILVHLFKNHRQGRLPTSQYGVFSLLVCTCVSRHLKEREKREHIMFDSLDQLATAEGVKEAFKFLCKLAYEGVMNDEITFTSLPAKLNTLSILQGVESFVKHAEILRSYNFIHLTIQELLAAFYIVTWLPTDQQVEQFEKLFGNPRFNAVFCFYAAMTKLQVPGIRALIAKVAEQCGEEDPSDQAKVLLVSLLHCLNEAQDPSLCEFVMKYLRNGLNLGHKTLSPTDCLCIGYFLSCVCKTVSDGKEFQVTLLNGQMGNEGCRYLAKGLQKHLDISGHDANTKLHLNLRWNNLHEAGSIELCGVLKTGCVSSMNMNGNEELGDEGALHIADHLQECTAFKELSIYTCGIRSKGGGYLARALRTNDTLTMLNIGGNGLCDEGVKELADALRHNHCLKSLNLSSCGMTDDGFKSLADLLKRNDTLTELKLYNFQNQKYPNELSDDGDCIKYLTESLKENDTLLDLVLPKDFESCITDLQNEVNGTREMNQLTVKVQGHTLEWIRKGEEERRKILELEGSSPPPSPQATVHSPMPRPKLWGKPEDTTETTSDEAPTTIAREDEAESHSPTVAIETQIEPTSYQLTDHDLRGVDVCGKTTVEVTNSPQSFYWTGYGLKLLIKENSLPEGVEKCTIDIYASIAGDYEFPENSYPVSPVFWLRCEPKYTFIRPITTKVQHCAKPQLRSKLCFVKAFCSQQSLPYTFRRLDSVSHFVNGTSCNVEDSSYEAIELNSFSGITVVRQKTVEKEKTEEREKAGGKKEEEEEEDEREYVAKSYYHTEKISRHNIHVVVTWDDETHLTAVRKKYGLNHDFSEGTELPIQFEKESNEIELDIPKKGIKLDEGWILTPLTPPIFVKKKIDCYKSGKIIPTCYLSARFSLSEEEDVPVLQHEVNLIGAKEPFNTFSIEPPYSIPKRVRHKMIAKKRRLKFRQNKAIRRRVYSETGRQDQVPATVSASMQKAASFGEYEGNTEGTSAKKVSHAGKEKRKSSRKRSHSTHTQKPAMVTPAVQKSASVDDVEKKRLEMLDETETESDEEPPLKKKQTERATNVKKSCRHPGHKKRNFTKWLSLGPKPPNMICA